MFSIKRVRFVILTRKGISIIYSNSALAATDKIYVYILRSKCGKSQVMVSIKSVRFVTNSKGINIDRSKSALAATDKIYVCGVRNTYLKEGCPIYTIRNGSSNRLRSVTDRDGSSLCVRSR